MFCMKCGALLPDDANFCFKCGCDLRNLSQSVGTELSVVKVGGYVKFGRYPHNDDVNKEPIEWLVLEVYGNEALLISRYGLDCEQYNYECVSLTWEKCHLRKWLNNDFLKAAFSVGEQRRIKHLKVANDDNRKYGTRGGNSTRDRFFCLSLAEAEWYFKNDDERKCKPTVYARNQGVTVNDSNGCCMWWLRSPGSYQDIASYVDADGVLVPFGLTSFSGLAAVRPAVWVNLES